MWLGAVVAAALWAPMSALLILLAPNDRVGWALSIAGLIVSPLVGAILAPEAVATRGRGAWIAALFSLMAVPGGAFAFGLVLAILTGFGPDAAISAATLGLLLLGIPFATFGFHLALVWVAIVRRLSRR